MTRLYYAVRDRVTREADCFGNWCDAKTDGAYRYRGPGLQRAARGVFQAAGSLAHAAKLLPRLDACRIEHGPWSAVWVGDGLMSGELEHLLFPAGAIRTPLRRVPVWGLRRFVDTHIARADIVVCALPRWWPWSRRPRGPVAFSCPIFVNLAIDISEPLETLLRGRSRRGLRAEWNRIQREGGRWHVTRDPADFESFYREMYVPHVTARHGSRALITPPDSLVGKWIRSGGSLILITQDRHPIAGVTVRTAGSTCILGEEGILESMESAGYSSGLQVGLKCAGIEFARSMGLTRLVLGRSLARLGDPVLVNKLRWGPAILPAGRSLHPEWTFVASRMDGPLVDQLNRQGIIAFAGRRPCVVSIGPLNDDRALLAARVGRSLVVEAGRPGRIEEVGA